MQSHATDIFLCQLHQDAVSCPTNLSTRVLADYGAHSLRESRPVTKQVTAERAEHVAHATKALPAIDRARQVRAEISGLEERVAEVKKETENIKAAHDAGASPSLHEI